MTPRLVLVAGPYRSGTHGDPARIAANLHRLEAAALAVYRRGHVPMIGDAIGEAFLYPAAHRLLRCCASAARRAERMRTWRLRGNSASRSISRLTRCRSRRTIRPIEQA